MLELRSQSAGRNDRVTGQWLRCCLRWTLPAVAPGFQIFDIGADLIAVAGGVLFALAIVVWWTFFSRAPWFDRIFGLVVMILAAIALQPLTHVSVQNGLMGWMFHGQPRPFLKSSARDDGCGHPRRLRRLDAGPDGGPSWRRSAAHVALDADCRRAAPGPGRRASVAPIATVPCAAFVSAPTGQSRRRSRCGGGPWGRAGHHSP